MTNSFEGTFGPQEEFPIGNRDREIDETISDIKSEDAEGFNPANQSKILEEVINRLEKKHNIDVFSLVPGIPEDDLEQKRAMTFLDLYDRDYIANRLSGHFK